MTTKRTKSNDPEAPARLRALRKAMGLTQDKVAELAQLPRDVIPRVEAGKNLESIRVQRGLARGFGITLDELTLYLDGKLTLEEVRRIQEIGAAAHGDLPGWKLAEIEARMIGGGVAPHEFMGARLMKVLRAPNGPVDAKFVIAVAWLFRGTATEEEARQAVEAERLENHPTSSVPPPAPETASG